VQNEERKRLSLRSELPAIAANDWLMVKGARTIFFKNKNTLIVSVLDLLRGTERGELRITLAAGTDEQVRRFEPMLKPDKTLQTETVSEERNSEDEERIYDSVHDSHESSSSESSRVDIEKERRAEEGSRNESVPVLRSTRPVVRHVQIQTPKENSPRKAEITRTIPQEVQNAFKKTVLLPEDSHVEEKQTRQCQTPHMDPFDAFFSIEEARNLPRVFSYIKDRKIEPSTFVTFQDASKSIQTSKIVPNNCNPSWNLKKKAKVEGGLLLSPRRFFVIKVWHHDLGDNIPNMESDHGKNLEQVLIEDKKY
jgi:hypothetical protein